MTTLTGFLGGNPVYIEVIEKAILNPITTNTSANWTTNNIILALGSIGIETDTNKRKTGNGTSTWNQLEYDIPFVEQKTGTLIEFIYDRVYGVVNGVITPETGNITVDFTGANFGTVVTVIHNHSVAPTYPAGFKKASTSGDYVTGQINYINFLYINGTEVVYNIFQRT